MASIVTRGSSYLVRWRPGRAAKFQNCTFPSQDKAIAAKTLAEAHKHRITDEEVYRAVLRLDDKRPTAKLTLREWSAQWLSTKSGIQADTLEDYGQIARLHILPTLGGYQLDQLTPLAIREWVGGQKARPASVHRRHMILHQMLADATAEKLIDDNPAARRSGRRTGLPRLDDETDEERTFLTPNEARKLLVQCPPQIRDLVSVALGTGLRLGELLALRVGDIDLDAQIPTLHVRRSLKRNGIFGPPKSRRSRRQVTLGPDTAKVLNRCVEGRTEGGIVFVAPRGNVWSPHNLRSRYWRPAILKANQCPDHMPAPERVRLDESTCDCAVRLGKWPRFHDLRHTHASWLIDAEWDLVAIQRRFGHESITTTIDTYGHLQPDRAHERIAALARVMSRMAA